MLYFFVAVLLVCGGQALILGGSSRRLGAHVALWLFSTVVMTSLFVRPFVSDASAIRYVRDTQRTAFVLLAVVVALTLWLGPKWARRWLEDAETWGQRFGALARVQVPLLLVGSIITFFGFGAAAISSAVW